MPTKIDCQCQGGVVKVVTEDWVTCGHCHGSGWEAINPYIQTIQQPCMATGCVGGYVRRVLTRWDPCPTCKGRTFYYV